MATLSAEPPNTKKGEICGYIISQLYISICTLHNEYVNNYK